MRKLQILILFSCVGWFNAVAQQLVQQIPSDAGLVISFNGSNLSKKVNSEKLYSLDMMHTMYQTIGRGIGVESKQVEQIMRTPEAAGLKSAADMYWHLTYLDTTIYSTFLVEVTDAEKLQKFLAETVFGAYDSISISQQGSWRYVVVNKIGIAWTNQVVRIVNYISNNTSSPYLQVDYADPDYDAKVDRLMEATVVREQEALRKFIVQDVKESLASTSPNFQLYLKEYHDAGFWFSFDTFAKITHQSFADIWRSMDPVSPKPGFGNIFIGGFIQAHVLFESGQARVVMHQYNSDKVNAILEGAYDNRINEHFLNYINKDNLIGFYAISIDVEKFARAIWELYKPQMEAMPMYKEEIMATLDLLDLAIDEKALLNLIDGDFLTAFTGKVTYEREFVSIQYDDDFEKTETTEVRTESIPEFVSIAGTGPEFNRLIKALVSFKLLELSENKLYYAFPKTQELPVPMYLVYRDNMLMITNSKEVIANLEKGIKKKSRLDGELAELVLSNSISGYLDFEQLFETLGTIDKSSTEEKKAFLILKSNLKDIRIRGSKKQGDKYVTEGALIFRDQKKNVVETMFQMFNELYMLTRPKN